MFCQKCGKEIDNDSKVCPECGEVVENVEEVVIKPVIKRKQGNNVACLVLGIVGLICTGALTVVYEITKEKIAYNQNAEAINLLSEIITDIKNAEPVFGDYDATKAKNAGIKNIYEVSDSNGVTAYGYLAECNGYNPGINYLLVLDSEEVITLNKVVMATRIINPILDKLDLISDSYTLDVYAKEKGDVE